MPLLRLPARTAAWVCTVVLLAGCNQASSPTGGTTPRRNDLAHMDATDLTIGSHRFRAWIADNDQTRTLGLMQVSQEELADLPDGTHRAMIFVFPGEQFLSFWMKDTLIPLDIAFISSDGRIVRTWTMAPLETRVYPSVEPAQFALEASAGLFARLGVRAGDRVQFSEPLAERAR